MRFRNKFGKTFNRILLENDQLSPEEYREMEKEQRSYAASEFAQDMKDNAAGAVTLETRLLDDPEFKRVLDDNNIVVNRINKPEDPAKLPEITLVGTVQALRDLLEEWIPDADESWIDTKD